MKKHEEQPEEIQEKEEQQLDEQTEAKENQDESVENESQENEESKAIDAEVEEEVSPLEKAQQAAADAKDKYLRLFSEFENFRRRTAKERVETIATASRELIEDLLPILDDFERAAQSANDEKATQDSVREGMDLIRQKLNKTLESKGLRKMEVKKGDKFDDDYHEAVTQIPAEKKLEGKIVDVIEPGYFLNDTVIRFAKVVTGAKQ